jgi:hypothetical protein
MTTFLAEFLTLSQQQSYRRAENIKDLETLIAPLSLKEFFKKYWKKKAAIIADDNPQKFRQLLYWEQLQNLLVDCPENHIKCFDNGTSNFRGKD